MLPGCFHPTDDREKDENNEEPGCDVVCASNDSAGISDPPVYPMHHRDPSWSRQGLIAYEDRGIICVDSCGFFYNFDPSLAGIWILNSETGEKRWLTTGGAPSWSPDGTRITFEAYGQIFTIRVDGTGLTRLTTSGLNFFPAWSPDGGTIAYDSNAGGSFYKIWLMQADGANKRNISQLQDGDWRESAWSPDGRRIAYERSVALGEIYSMDVEGSNTFRITSNQAIDQFPAYSPDGQWIAFASQSIGGDPLPQIWIVRPDGTGARQLTSHAGSHPSWSPDGTKIVYFRDDWTCKIPENGVLWVVDVSSGEETQLTVKWPERCGWESYSIFSDLPSRRATQPVHP